MPNSRTLLQRLKIVNERLDAQGYSLSPESIFQCMIANSPIGMFLCNSKGTVLVANPALHDLFGYEDQTLVGNSIDLLVPEDYREKHTEQRQAFLEENSTRWFRTVKGLTWDRSVIDVEVALQPVKVNRTADVPDTLFIIGLVVKR